MKTSNIRGVYLLVMVIAILLASFGLVYRPTSPNDDNIINLQLPPFVNIASAKGTDTVIASLLDSEAGISAYFQADHAINLNDVRSLFRTIELETPNYIIGSIPVPTYDEAEDVHAYVNIDGWVLVYYLRDDPVSRIFDWKSYNGVTISTTRLQNVLAVIASAVASSFPSPTYYHFRYPNATNLMLVADERLDDSGYTSSETFEINLPSSYQYYEKSWSLGSHVQNCGNNNEHSTLYLNGTQIGYNRHCCDTWAVQHAKFGVSQLLPDSNHEIKTEVNCGYAWGGLAILYRVP